MGQIHPTDVDDPNTTWIMNAFLWKDFDPKGEISKKTIKVEVALVQGTFTCNDLWNGLQKCPPSDANWPLDWAELQYPKTLLTSAVLWYKRPLIQLFRLKPHPIPFLQDSLTLPRTSYNS